MVRLKAILEVLFVATKLGLISFGGPIAHLSYFYSEYVKKREWVDEKSYSDLIALCQVLPGPTSSQVGIAIGTMRAGLWGGVAAWLGFTWPSATALFVFASLYKNIDFSNAGWIHGLKLVAVAIVAQAIWDMSKKFILDKSRFIIAIAASIILLIWQTALAQILVILFAGIFSSIVHHKPEDKPIQKFQSSISTYIGACCLVILASLLVFLPLISYLTGFYWIYVCESFFRVGSLVFGGGHVVLPLLESNVVSPGWVSKEEFLVGYAATQAVPGPLFTFASYLGAVMGGSLGAIVTTIAIFLPSFLLIIGVLPFWEFLRNKQIIQGALIQIQAAVIGILLAAFYNPILTGSIYSSLDLLFAIILFFILTYLKLPSWSVVIIGILGGSIIN